MTDKKRPDFESVCAEYERIGLDSVDYNMLKSWNFCDKKIYTDNLLQKVIGINNSNDVKKHLSFLDAFQVLINRCVFAYPVALVLYILTIFVCLLDKNRLYAVILLLGSVALLLAFVFYGRSVYRVDWGILYCAVSCVLAGFNYNETCSMAVLKRKFLGKEIGVLTLYSLVFVALILFIRFPRVFKISSYKNLPETEYKSAFLDTMFNAGIYLPDKTVFPIVPNKLHPNLLELTENDKEHFYYIDSYTTIQELYFNYSPWFRPKHGLFCDDYIYLGAVTMHHPGEVYALSANGCDPYNPFISITNKNVFFVDNLGAKDKLEYVRRYYYPNAELELIGIYDGFYVWNIYIPDTVVNK
jgi:hypothetical protein